MNDDIAKQTLAVNVRRLMDEQGWSLTRLQRETGDPMMSLYNFVSGKHLPRIGIVARVADALGVPVDTLLDPRQRRTTNSKKTMATA